VVVVDESNIAQLFVANEIFDELELALDIFCPFEAVGMVRQEVRHGHFLSYILDPQRPHGFGSACIRALMAAAAKSDNGIAFDLNPLDVHLMDFDGTLVKREWRRIDILLEVPDAKLVVCVELKIDASEHSGQLRRYRQIVEAEWPKHRHLFLFLTKRGDEPSDDDGNGWLSVNLDTLVSELKVIADQGSGSTDAKGMLSAYLSMLRRHHLNDERLEELAGKLWAKHQEALEFLSDRRPDAFGEVFQILSSRKDEIAQKITKQCGVEVCLDHSTPANIRLAVKAWDKIPDYLCSEGFTPSKRLIVIEIIKASSSDDTLRCYFQLGKGNPIMREKLFFKLKEKEADVGKKAKPTKEWNRLASVTITKVRGAEDLDLVEAADLVEARIITFLTKHIPIYHAALSELI
jgi:PD-(D/E)XK nuclease superfamily